MANKKETISDLQTHLHDLSERARQLADDTAKIEAQLKQARGTRRSVPPPFADDTYSQVVALVKARPMTLQELVSTTGAELNKVKTALVKMQREEIGLKNLGNQYRAIWFIPDEELLARLRK